jgi:hypothetical protein
VDHRLLTNPAMDFFVTGALAGTVVLAAVGGVALWILVARFGIGPAADVDAWTARHVFFARLTSFTVGASLALAGVLAAVGLAASVRSASVTVAASPSPAERQALEARIRALEATLDELDLRVGRGPAAGMRGVAGAAVLPERQPPDR